MFKDLTDMEKAQTCMLGTCVIYIFITVALLVAAIINVSMPILYVATMVFGITVLTMIVTIIYIDMGEETPNLILIMNYSLMSPLTVTCALFYNIFRVIKIIYLKLFKRKGDDYDG